MRIQQPQEIDIPYHASPVVKLLGRQMRSIVIAFVILMVLGELHIGQRLIRDSFLILLGGVTLAAALAFGLGGRRWAAHVLERDWPRERQQGIGEGLDRR